MDLIPSVIPEEEKKRIEVILALSGIKTWGFEYVCNSCRLIVKYRYDGTEGPCGLPSSKVYLYFYNPSVLPEFQKALIVTPCEKHVERYIENGWKVL